MNSPKTTLDLSISAGFIAVHPTAPEMHKRITSRRQRTPADTAKALDGLPFTAVYDILRLVAREAVERGDTQRAIAVLSDLELHLAALPEAEAGHTLDIRAALMQVITALYIVDDQQSKGAASAAASTLHLLARAPRRKDAPFMEVLASLLFDLAILHSAAGEYRQAERDMEKSIKLYERLAKTDPERFASTVIDALAAATRVYRDRVRQAELLAHYQAATVLYTAEMKAGVEEAADRLAESLTAEGDTLARMGRHREAIQYYTRAMKLLRHIEGEELTLRQLRLSRALGEAMLRVGAMKEKGVHLLNTMLHKALKLNAPDEHARISDLLDEAKKPWLDILGLWHKMFPK
ncbi:MAG: tetratricopeptide repeat protein [Duncaniella sp.]|nr:tetratricopeptide repeat protein [Duncaniella sp.]